MTTFIRFALIVMTLSAGASEAQHSGEYVREFPHLSMGIATEKRTSDEGTYTPTFNQLSQRPSTSQASSLETMSVDELLVLADQGNVGAQFYLGVFYFFGEGIVQDYAEAARWHLAAAEQGHAPSQFIVGMMHYLSQGVVQDYAEAARWYRASAEQGHTRAQEQLGMMYFFGRGVAQDYAEAHMWFNIAAANGQEEAREKRDVVAGLMTSEVIAEAQRRARLCLSSCYQECD